MSVPRTTKYPPCPQLPKPKDKRISLKDLLQYYEPKEERIQVHIEGEGEWENYIEVPAGSLFLKTFLDWKIVAISADVDDTELSNPIIRVSISEEEET